ncbi:hypothetical protein ABZW18_27070 [Streptomyces sp. NPDC004647]|uniref:hypothetical protein n=1 Tax=Streptomyces sp. NPDC004647 TaxID=3154671 RepID=UPI0033A0A6B7
MQQSPPHIPTDVFQRAQATGQPVVFVVNDTPSGLPWRRIVVPFAIVGAVVAGGWGLVAAICFLLDAAAHTFTVIADAAGPLGIGGITLRLARSKNT